MVTIYDMVTGEVLVDDSHAGSTASAPAQGHDQQLALQLRPLAEETPAQPHRQSLPADLATASVTAFLARQHS